MSDRDDFEAGQVHQDQEGDPGDGMQAYVDGELAAYEEAARDLYERIAARAVVGDQDALRELPEARAAFVAWSREGQGLEQAGVDIAEGDAGGSVTLVNGTGEPVTFRVMGKDLDEPRYGSRLRGEVLERARVGQQLTPAGLDRIADAIDRDVVDVAFRAVEKAEAARERLRRQVEEAVEELAYVIANDGRLISRLDAEPFLARLAAIFGERAEESWRCFHCGQTFTGDAAAEHCISTRHPLVVRLRERIHQVESPARVSDHTATDLDPDFYVAVKGNPEPMPCPKCGSATGYSVDEGDGDFEDEHHRCQACGADWWVEGGDS